MRCIRLKFNIKCFLLLCCVLRQIIEEHLGNIQASSIILHSLMRFRSGRIIRDARIETNVVRSTSFGMFFFILINSAGALRTSSILCAKHISCAECDARARRDVEKERQVTKL